MTVYKHTAEIRMSGCYHTDLSSPHSGLKYKTLSVSQRLSTPFEKKIKCMHIDKKKKCMHIDKKTKTHAYS